MSDHPRPWHRGSIFGDGHRMPMDRERRAVWKARVEIHRRAGRLTDAGSYVALALLRRLGTDGRCDPSHQTLADDSGKSIDTVKRALKAMQVLGMIEWARRVCREGARVWQTSNSYLLWLSQSVFRCEGDSARETRRIDLTKALPDERRVFDVPTEDRLNALQALAEVAQRRLAAIWKGRAGG
jgi:DNA-binding transcriptional MocR family regulator